jgi:hypothetical protein
MRYFIVTLEYKLKGDALGVGDALSIRESILEGPPQPFKTIIMVEASQIQCELLIHTFVIL